MIARRPRSRAAAWKTQPASSASVPNSHSGCSAAWRSEPGLPSETSPEPQRAFLLQGGGEREEKSRHECQRRCHRSGRALAVLERFQRVPDVVADRQPEVRRGRDDVRDADDRHDHD